MHRVDTSTASAVLPAVDASAAPGYFTKGNPANATPATVPGHDWFNMVQEELNHVVEVAGLTPDQTKLDYTQLAQAITLMSVPVGSVITGYFYTIPAGFIEPNGAILSRVTDANLWNYISTINAADPGLIVTDAAWLSDPANTGLFSSGDGGTTFRIPNLSDLFIRLKSAGRGSGSHQIATHFLVDDDSISTSPSIGISSSAQLDVLGYEQATLLGSGSGLTSATSALITKSYSLMARTSRPENVALRAILKR